MHSAQTVCRSSAGARCVHAHARSARLCASRRHHARPQPHVPKRRRACVLLQASAGDGSSRSGESVAAAAALDAAASQEALAAGAAAAAAAATDAAPVPLPSPADADGSNGATPPAAAAAAAAAAVAGDGLAKAAVHAPHQHPHHSSSSSSEDKAQPLFGKDMKRLWQLAVPLMINNVAGYMLSIVGAIYIGRLGSLPLSASVLANSVYNCTGLSLALGLSAGMETLCGQAYGAGAYLRLGVILQRALLVCWTLCVPVVLLWSQSHALLLQLGQQPEIAALASRYLVLCIPCLFLTTTIECIRKFLQAQRAVKPAMTVSAVTLAASPLFFWLLVVRCQLGLDGAACAFVACQVATLIGLLGYTAYRAWAHQGKRDQTWGGWSSQAFQGWGEYCQYGLPAAAMIAAEWWCYEVIILMAGLLPDAAVTLSTMGTCLTINAWLYMMPLGLSQAVNTSISNALGAGHAASAKRAFIGGLLSGTAMQGLLVLLIITQGRALVGLFTTDPAVITSSCAVLPLLAILVFFDGLNSVVSGVLRGSGRQMLGATVNAFGYFVVGLPLCALLAFKAGWGVEGLWWGVIVGACVQAVVLLSMLLRWEWPREVARVQALLKHAEASGKPMPSFGH